MEGQSPVSNDSRRKRRRLSLGSAARRPSEPASSTGELGSMRRGLANGSSSFVGSGSGIYFVRTVQAAFARNYSRRGSEAIEGDIVPGEDDRLQSRNPLGSLWTPAEVDFTEPPPKITASFDDYVQWSQEFFNNWHPPFPFLVGANVLELFEKASLHGWDSLRLNENIIIRAILSIALADRRQMPQTTTKPIPAGLVFQTIDDAITCTTPIIRRPSTLGGLQTLISVQLFLISMLHLNAASRLGGLIVRIAFQMGLHRCPTRFEQFSSSDRDIRRRVFWTLYTFERYLSQALGLPLDLEDDDIDVCYADKELHAASNQNNRATTTSSHDSRVMLLPTLLARHGKIRGMILELRHISMKSRTTDPDEVAHVEAEISKWWNEAQDLLDPHFGEDLDANESCDAKDDAFLRSSHKLLLVVQKHESTILLNRPVISSGQNSYLFSAAMQKCIGASKQVISKVYQHLQEGSRKTSDFRLENPLFWPGFTWAVWMSGLILLYAASEGHYAAATALRESDRCVKILESLSLRGSVWPGTCAIALRDLRQALTQKSTMESIEAISNSSHTLSGEVTSINGSLNVTNAFNRGPNLRGDYGSGEGPNNEEQNPGEHFPHISLSGHDRNAVDTRFSETPNQNVFEPNSFGQPNMDFGFDWRTLGAEPTFGDGSLSGFNDIFQLMDVSYQMSEQMFDPTYYATPGI